MQELMWVLESTEHVQQNSIDQVIDIGYFVQNISYSIVKVGFDRILLLFILPLRSKQGIYIHGCHYLSSVCMYLYFDKFKKCILKR